MILTKSGLSDAPPTRDPSMSGQAASARQLSAVTEPPYRMRTLSETSAESEVDVKASFHFIKQIFLT